MDDLLRLRLLHFGAEALPAGSEEQQLKALQASLYPLYPLTP